MNTQNITRNDGTTFTVDGNERKKKLFVIYASSQTIGIDGAPIEQSPLELIEDDADGGAVARAMVKAGNVYTDADGWIIERVDAHVIPAADRLWLAKRLSIASEVWDEFICLPDGICSVRGGAGFLTIDCCSERDEKYELRGDCKECDGTGEL